MLEIKKGTKSFGSKKVLRDLDLFHPVPSLVW